MLGFCFIKTDREINYRLLIKVGLEGPILRSQPLSLQSSPPGNIHAYVIQMKSNNSFTSQLCRCKNHDWPIPSPSPPLLPSPMHMHICKHWYMCATVTDNFRKGCHYLSKPTACPSRRRLRSKPQSRGPSTVTKSSEHLQPKTAH